MQTEPIPGPGERLGAVESAIRGMLVVPDDQRPWSVREIELVIGDPERVADALWSLHGCGLIHRLGDFVWATRAAVAADELAG